MILLRESVRTDISLCIMISSIHLSEIKKKKIEFTYLRKVTFKYGKTCFKSSENDCMGSGLIIFLYLSMSIFSKVVSSLITEMYYSPIFQLLSHSNFLQHHGLQHARPHCPSLTPRVCSNSRTSN